MSLAKGLLVAAAAVMVATPVLAQVPVAGPQPASTAQSTAQPPSQPVAAAPAAPAYSDSDMRAFARATVDLQLVDPRDVSGQTRAIEATGMSVEKYNRMGDAMRGDPNLASRLNPYLVTARAERPAIPGYTPNAYARSYSRRSTASHRASSHHSSRRLAKSHSRKSKVRHASARRGHKASSRHAKVSVHKAASHRKSAARHVTTHRKRHR